MSSPQPAIGASKMTKRKVIHGGGRERQRKVKREREKKEDNYIHAKSAV